MLRDMRKLGGFVLSIVVIFSVGIWGLVNASRNVKGTQAQSTANNAPMPAMPACPDSAGNHLNWVGGALICGTSAARTTLTCTTGSIGGSLILLNQTTSGTCTASGAVAGTPCLASPSDGTVVLGVGVAVDCQVTSANTATVTLYALVAATPAAKTYNVTIP